MKKLLAILVAFLSVPFFTLGVLFLIAAARNPSRLWVGLALTIAGAAILIASVRWLRRLAELSPEALKTGAVELARRLGGELTVSQLRAEYHLSQEQATQVLEGLVREGTCEREPRDERVVYVFKELAPSLVQKVCPYCGTKLPVRSGLRKCPNCGAPLELTKT